MKLKPGDDRYGAARWGDMSDITKGRLLGRHGVPIGFFDQRLLRVDSDGHVTIWGGAGTGKGRDVIIPMIARLNGERMLCFDPRGELAAVTIHNFVRWKAYAYCINPTGMLPGILPQHSCNVLDILKADDLRLHADAPFIAAALIPLARSKGQWWEVGARQYVACLLKALCERDGTASLPSLFRAVNAINSDPAYFDALLITMKGSRFDDVRNCAGSMVTQMQDAPREFAAVTSTMRAALDFMADPQLQRSFGRSDFSLEALTDRERSVSVFVNVPIEYVGIWSPLLRTIYTVTALYKQRNPNSPRVNMLVDEAGQLGRFEELLQSLTYGRGAGLRVISVFQSTAQIVRNFDAPVLEDFMGSSETRLFLCPRDLQTATMISHMVGMETRGFENRVEQQAAKRKQWDAMQRALWGGDPFAAAYDFDLYGEAAQNISRVQRPLLMPAETLSLADDEIIAFISGRNLPPLRIKKLPYWMQRDLNGYWLNNPWHSNEPRVRLRGIFGFSNHAIVTAEVPPHLREYPQHQDGLMRYVAGDRPF